MADRPPAIDRAVSALDRAIRVAAQLANDDSFCAAITTEQAVRVGLLRGYLAEVREALAEMIAQEVDD